MGRAPHVGRFELEGERDLAAARAALEALDLWALRDRPVGEVSGGERQRAAIARALAQETPVLVLDEPTAHLDVRHILDVYRLLRRLQGERGLTVVAATHDLNLAAHFAGRLALLKGGAIRASGPPAEILRPELIREVFDAEVEVAAHPRTGRPFLFFGSDA
jgi:iron complex transport system ATP-binding protein